MHSEIFLYEFLTTIFEMICGLVFVICGYKLFIKGVSGSTGEIGGHFSSFNISFKNASPGALVFTLGCIIIGFAIFSKKTMKHTKEIQEYSTPVKQDLQVPRKIVLEFKKTDQNIANHNNGKHQIYSAKEKPTNKAEIIESEVQKYPYTERFLKMISTVSVADQDNSESLSTDILESLKHEIAIDPEAFEKEVKEAFENGEIDELIDELTNITDE